MWVLAHFLNRLVLLTFFLWYCRSYFKWSILWKERFKKLVLYHHLITLIHEQQRTLYKNIIRVVDNRPFVVVDTVPCRTHPQPRRSWQIANWAIRVSDWTILECHHVCLKIIVLIYPKCNTICLSCRNELCSAKTILIVELVI